MLQIRLVGLLAVLVLSAAPCACAPAGSSASGADSGPDPRPARPPQGAQAAPPAASTPRVQLAPGAEADELGLRPGDLVIVDADAGSAVAATAADGAAGEPAKPAARRGALFRAAAEGDGWAQPEILAQDDRWLEPVDVLVLPDRSLLVLEQQWSPSGGAAHGAVFHVTRRGTFDLWWTDERLRQPVAMARAADGTVYVSDRAADPLGLQRDTGCVFAVAAEPAGAGEARPATIAAAGPELVTPCALLVREGAGHLLILDADANPRHLVQPNGQPDTPGVLYELRDGALKTLLEPEETTSPIALIERRPGELFLVDANAGDSPGVMGDGAIFRLEDGRLRRVLDSAMLHRPRALVDPVGGDTLADGRLVLADANADPLHLGEDGTGKGVYGTGHGAIVAVDPDAPAITTLLADERFVSPLAVRRVRP
jgi:hypothetical protein